MLSTKLTSPLFATFFFSVSMISKLYSAFNVRLPCSRAAFATYAPAVFIPILLLTFAWSPWDGWRLLGAVLVIVFLVLLTVARLQLGNSFSVTAQARKLVTTGVYSRVRHPIYVFSSVIVLGFAFYFKISWIAFLLMIILPVQFFRACQEEKVLIRAFGEAYLSYRKTTRF
jgi:protein-S-isoprenylcysteine O-methyltransferase Ste14